MVASRRNVLRVLDIVSLRLNDECWFTSTARKVYNVCCDRRTKTVDPSHFKVSALCIESWCISGASHVVPLLAKKTENAFCSISVLPTVQNQVSWNIGSLIYALTVSKNVKDSRKYHGKELSFFCCWKRPSEFDRKIRNQYFSTWLHISFSQIVLTRAGRTHVSFV